jgi:putative phosphoesterase
MKIAVLSDVHGNLPALRAVAAHVEEWRPDLVVVNGDIVNRGPCSRSCLQFIQEMEQVHGWQLVKGNHEEYVIACGRPDAPTQGPAYEIRRFAFWAYQQLDGDVAALEAMPDRFTWQAPDGSEFRVVHASMRNNRDGIYLNTPDETLTEQIAPVPDVFVTGHTHRPLIRYLNGTVVANVGAVGAPFDRDRRASYGQFTWDRSGWTAMISRVPYDLKETERDYVTSGFLKEAGPLAQLMLVELRRAHGLIYRWAEEYQDAIMAGDISVEDSVRKLLVTKNVRPYLGPPGWVL